jgi:adenylate cyclase
LSETKEVLQRGNALIRRYVPSQLADRLLSREHAEDGHERRTLTIFFSDVQDFTETADQLEAEDLSRLLNEYLSEMVAIVEEHGGTVDKFIGDALMVLFGAPMETTQKEDAVRAVRMALAMQARLRDLGHKWWNEGIQAPFRARMGINTGLASVGNFGSTARMDYTAIGNQVNLAARV